MKIIPEDMYTTTEVSLYLGVTVSALKTWRHKKRYDLPFYTIGNGIRYLGSDVIAWRAAQRR